MQDIMKYIPFYKDVKFIMGRVSWPSQEEASKRAWIVGVIMVTVGLIGFITHLVLNLI